MHLLGLGTANDWTGRTSDFAGMGTVMLVVLVLIGTWMLLRSRVGDGAAVGLASVTSLITLAGVQVFAMRPSPWWMLTIGTFALVATWDLRRTMRRSR